MKIRINFVDFNLPICMRELKFISSHLQNVFWPHIFGAASSQILANQSFGCVLRPTNGIRPGGKSRLAGKPGPAAILNQVRISEIAAR
jgi:hypothetical protein